MNFPAEPWFIYKLLFIEYKILCCEKKIEKLPSFNVNCPNWAFSYASCFICKLNVNIIAVCIECVGYIQCSTKQYCYIRGYRWILLKFGYIVS